MKLPSFGLCFISRPQPVLCTWSPANNSVAPKGGRGPRLRNPDLETRVANVWDLVQSDQQNLATQTGLLSRLDLYDYGQTYYNYNTTQVLQNFTDEL